MPGVDEILDAVTPMHLFQATVILGCMVVYARSGDRRSREESRAWGRHPFTIRALAQTRGAGSEDAFVWKLGCAGIDAVIARTLWQEIQMLVDLHYGYKNFPVRPEDELRRTYLFSVDAYTGYPDDPDLLGSAWMIAQAAKRRIPKEPELQLAQLRTVLDLARWVHELPPDATTATSTSAGVS
jgi:hypothetical protein